MRDLRAILYSSTLCLGLATGPASSGELFSDTFGIPPSGTTLACTGQNQSATITHPLTQRKANATILLNAAEAILFENRGGLQFLTITARNSAITSVAILSFGLTGGDNRVFNNFDFNSIALPVSAANTVVFDVVVACSNPPGGNIQAALTFWYQ